MWQKHVATAQRLLGKVVTKASPKAREQRRDFIRLRREFYTEFWTNASTNIGATIQKLGNGWFLISREGKSTFAHTEKVMLDNSVTLQLAANKALMYGLLEEDGSPVPRSQLFTLDTIEKAYQFQKGIQDDVVVKPLDGWAGNGVTVNIKTPEALQKAAIDASQYGSEILVEQHILGDSYRLLFLDGKFIDAVRRDPPHIIGDGEKTIKQLIEDENAIRVTQSPIRALSPITIDADCKRKLKEQGLSLKSVPALNEKIIIKKVVNHNSYVDNHIVRQDVHPDIITMGSEISRRYGIELSGLDILTTDISKSMDETGGVINEINTTPGLHHHVLVSNPLEAEPIGEKVLEYILDRHPIIR